MTTDKMSAARVLGLGLTLFVFMLCSGITAADRIEDGPSLTASRKKGLKAKRMIIAAMHKVKDNEITLEALDGKTYEVLNTDSEFAKAMFRTDKAVLYVTVTVVKERAKGGDVNIGEWASDAWNEETEDLKIKYANVILKLAEESAEDRKLRNYR